MPLHNAATFDQGFMVSSRLVTEITLPHVRNSLFSILGLTLTHLTRELYVTIAHYGKIGSQNVKIPTDWL